MRFAHFSQLFNKPDLTGYARYEQMWRELELADDLGFDYGFQSIHHCYKLRPTPAMYCTGGAMRTQRMRLGPMGYIVGVHNPFQIVEEAALLDQATNGRLELGLVLGVYPDYYRVYGANGENRRGLARETIELVKAGLSGEGNFSFEGPFHRYEDVEMAIKSVQKPHPPMWLPSTDPDTLSYCAHQGVHTGYTHLLDRHEMAPRLKEYKRQWAEAGHEQSPNIGYFSVVYVDETDEAALRKGTEPVVYNAWEVFGHTPTWGGVFHDPGSSLGPRSSEHRARKQDMEYLLENNLVFVGSPDTVVKRIKEAASEGHFNIFAAEFNLGDLGEADLMRSIRLFGTEVMPALRDFEPADA